MIQLTPDQILAAPGATEFIATLIQFKNIHDQMRGMEAQATALSYLADSQFAAIHQYYTQQEANK